MGVRPFLEPAVPNLHDVFQTLTRASQSSVARRKHPTESNFPETL